MSNILRSVLCLSGLLFAVGCGSDQVPVWPTKGKVVFEDGRPVRTGNIEFESELHGLTASGRIQPDGSFVLGTYTPSDGAAAGIHKVIVVQLVVNDGTINHTMDHGKPVPAKYASYETSELTATVSRNSSNDLKVFVKADKKK